MTITLPPAGIRTDRNRPRGDAHGGAHADVHVDVRDAVRDAVHADDRYGPRATALDGSPTATRAADKPLISDTDLPGPLSLRLLAGYGMLSPLDGSSAYQVAHAETLYGRASIVAGLAPRRTIACAFTAAWIWLGGEFPDTIDIISRSHYRSVVHGHRIRVFNRKTKPEHIITVGATRVTTPARTACDLALLPSEEIEEGADLLIEQLMAEYQVTPDDCLAILELNRFWPRAPLARDLFEKLGI